MSELSPEATDPRRALPSIAAVIRAYRAAGGTFEEWAVKPIVQREIEGLRSNFANDALAIVTTHRIVHGLVERLLTLETPKLESILNGNGVIIHTNLGRAPVSAETAAAMARAAASTVSLELDPVTNKRGQRMSEIALLVSALTGAESALLVNNNAAAILLTLSALANGREVIVSRGEAVEIGGGFRIPDVLAQSGAVMVEIGTTNRTYAADYARSINAETSALLKVHPSNFHLSGFTHSAPIPELADLAHEKGVALIEDQGSGALIDPARFGLTGERTVSQSLTEGVDLVTFSCDKLLGGPQGGIIAGNRAMIERISKHPLARAVRADKATLAGVAETLRHYMRGDATAKIPVWRMITATIEDLETRGRRIQHAVPEAQFELVSSATTVGGGSLPGQTIPSLALSPNLKDRDDVDLIATALRLGTPGVFSRIHDGRLTIDLRTILPEDDDRLIQALSHCFT